jgi:hypothetical protein
MLNDLRQRAAAALSAASEAILITYGPAGLQAARVPCAARGLRLYALVLRTSDLLFNLEQQPEALAVTADWQLRGAAAQLSAEQMPVELALSRAPEAPWCAVVAITPTRLHLSGDDAGQHVETIDL